MASGDYDRPREFSMLAMSRIAGWAILVLAGCVGYFHANIWMAAAKADKFNALFGALGVLLLAAILPLLIIMIARAWRDREFNQLEGVAAHLYDMLHSRGGDLSTREIIHHMIGVYGAAKGVNRRLGILLLIGLSLALVAGAHYIDKLVGTHVFTHNQANLLILFTMMSGFAFLCLIWFEADRAQRFDPADLLASYIR